MGIPAYFIPVFESVLCGITKFIKFIKDPDGCIHPSTHHRMIIPTCSFCDRCEQFQTYEQYKKKVSMGTGDEYKYLPQD